MKYQQIIFILFVLAISVFSCGKDGAPGPQGEKGDQGEQGEQGPKGDNGAANVVYSAWMPSKFGGASYSVYLMAEIDNNTFSTNTAVFLVYCKEEPSDIVSPLPMRLDETTYGFYVAPPRSETPTISRLFLFRDGPQPTSLPLGRNLPSHFRYVLIPGGVSAGGRTVNYADMDYEEIKVLFNIPD